MTAGWTIGQLAKTVGVNIQTVRYYERLKLLSPSVRRPSGYRVYGENEERRLRFIRNAQSLGFTLHEIEELLNLRVSSTGRCSEVQQTAHTKLKHVEGKVRDLRALAKALRSLISACKANRPTDRCPILTSLETERGRPAEAKTRT